MCARMDYMEQAISLAKLAQGTVSPNPAVGAVLVKNGVVLGQGFTQPPGLRHAEIVALDQAGERARGSTLYVTLEPCCHYGNTPPCTEAIITAGVSRVHMAMLDPNPLVNGKGRAELETAGIKTSVGKHETAVRQINEAYIKYISTGIPFITVKIAMSLDGKIATASGDSRWISNTESRQFAHTLRHFNDAIMAGVNTVLADDPHLTSRFACGRGGTGRRQPLRVIVDGRGRAPHSARVFHEAGKTILAFGRHATAEEKKAFRALDTEIIEFPSHDNSIDLKELLRTLGLRQITSVLVEGGGILAGALFDQGLVDKAYVFIAPIIIGGQGRSAVVGKGANLLADAFHLEKIAVTRFADDTLVSGYVAPKTV
ncbi:MAG: bifunctional diaminohydroxyphosphoribosylaminopyrimidine deaminase/5-amino-6-(5-phosphoribosylamino)uracil reductase RibD [Dehalococcoidia bacterium]|nr:bifunctional diaminohydroxyphosphoribosylaminopyrimidine deaminase/5-amino-6-(5-phosphoribosylamino)uracil reductase RibD [Dehalococcoidia bacterium]